MLGVAGLGLTFTSLLVLLARQLVALTRPRETPPAPRPACVPEDPMPDLEFHLNRAAARDFREVLVAYGVCAAAHRHEIGADG